MHSRRAFVRFISLRLSIPSSKYTCVYSLAMNEKVSWYKQKLYVIELLHPLSLLRNVCLGDEVSNVRRLIIQRFHRTK